VNGAYKIPAGSPVHYCKLCGAHVYWVETGRRRKRPVDPDGGVDADDILCLEHGLPRLHVCLGKIKRGGM